MSNVFTVEDMVQHLNKVLDKYNENGIEHSVVRNGHMNDYAPKHNSVKFIKDADFNEPVALEMLKEFIDYSTPTLKLDHPTVGDIVLGLARKTPFVDTYENKLRKEVREAVIIDFVNYVGVTYGMDLAMYTKDLNKERANGN